MVPNMLSPHPTPALCLQISCMLSAVVQCHASAAMLLIVMAMDSPSETACPNKLSSKLSGQWCLITMAEKCLEGWRFSLH